MLHKLFIPIVTLTSDLQLRRVFSQSRTEEQAANLDEESISIMEAVQDQDWVLEEQRQIAVAERKRIKDLEKAEKKRIRDEEKARKAAAKAAQAAARAAATATAGGVTTLAHSAPSEPESDEDPCILRLRILLLHKVN